MNADFGNWKTVRTLLTQVAEAAPATNAGFVALAAGAVPRVEVRVRGGSLAGAPASVTLAIWRLSEGSIDKLGSITIASGDIAQPIPQLFELYDSNAYITVESFSGGAAPTLTATIEARAVSGG